MQQNIVLILNFKSNMFSIVRLKPHLKLKPKTIKFRILSKSNFWYWLVFGWRLSSYLKKRCFFTISFRLMIDYNSLGIKTAIWCQNYWDWRLCRANFCRKRSNVLNILSSENFCGADWADTLVIGTLTQ